MSDDKVEDLEKEQQVEEKPVEDSTSTEEEPEEEDESQTQTLSVKEIDEIYEDIKRASNSGDTDKEKELVQKAVEAERKRHKRAQQQKKEQQEKEQLKSKVDELEQALNSIKEQSSGRSTKVPQGNPFERTNDGKVKIPKEDFDRAARNFMAGK